MSKLYRSTIIVLIICLSLIGCSSRTFYPPGPYVSKTAQVGLAGTAGGAVIGAYYAGGLGAGFGAILGGLAGTVIGHFIQQNQTLLEKIQDQGVQIVIVGDNLLMILPSDKFFYPNSPNRIHSSDQILMDISKLVRRYEKITVNVTAYSDTTRSPQRAVALTQQQAQDIADFLWANGIDTRILLAKGYGSAHPIANNASAYGRAQNRRIEIRLRVLPKCCILSSGTG